MSELDRILDEIIAKKNKLTELKSVDVFEVSFTDSPAVPGAEVVLAKADSGNNTDTEGERMTELEKAVDKRNNYEDELIEKAEKLADTRGINTSLAMEKIIAENPNEYWKYLEDQRKVSQATARELYLNSN